MTLAHRIEGDLGHIADHNEIADHVNNLGDKHPATAVTNTPAGGVAATDVQAAVNELDSDITAHLNDTTAAHAATAIANTPAGGVAASTVQAAINELDTEASAHVAASTSVHGITNTSLLVASSNTSVAGWSFISNDTTLAADSATKLATEHAVKGYVDAVPGLGAGQDLQLNAVSGGVQTVQVTDHAHNLWTPLYVEAASDQTINNSVTLVDDAELQLAVAANTTYVGEAYVEHDASFTARLKWNTLGPAGATARILPYMLAVGEAGGLGDYNVPQAVNINTSQNTGGGNATANTTVVYFRLGIRLVVAGTAGTFKLQIAQQTATVENTKRKAASFLTLRPVVVP